MPSKYLQTDERVNYGVPSATDPQIVQASILIDAHLKRPEGLEYVVDSDGVPVCMSALLPNANFVVAGGITPGTNRTVQATGPLQGLKKGTVLVAEKGTPANAEALVVSVVSGAYITFQTVLKTHAAPTTLEGGLTIRESRHLPQGRAVAMLSRGPIAQIFSVQGRYGPSRRGRFPFPGQVDALDLVGMVSQFSPDAIWEGMNVSAIDYNADTGEMWLPSGVLMAPYSEISASYIAGFPSTSIPSQIKQVVANLIMNQAASPLAGNLKLLKAGDTQMERFLATVMGTDELFALEAYRARVFA